MQTPYVGTLRGSRKAYTKADHSTGLTVTGSNGEGQIVAHIAHAAEAERDMVEVRIETREGHILRDLGRYWLDTGEAIA